MFHVNSSFRKSRYITCRVCAFRFHFVPFVRTSSALSFSKKFFPAVTLTFQSPLPPKPVVASGRSLPLAALCPYRPTQNIKSDTLEANTRDPEGTGSIRLVHVLRGGVLLAQDRFFDQQLRGLDNSKFVSVEPIRHGN